MEKSTFLKKFLHEVVPNAVVEKNEILLQVIPLVAPAVGELLVPGHSLIDLVVPVATAAVLGVGAPEELAKEAASPVHWQRVDCPAALPGRLRWPVSRSNFVDEESGRSAKEDKDKE